MEAIKLQTNSLMIWGVSHSTSSRLIKLKLSTIAKCEAENQIITDAG